MAACRSARRHADAWSARCLRCLRGHASLSSSFLPLTSPPTLELTLRAQYDCVENAPTSVNAKEWVNLTTAQTWPCPLTLECQTERDYGDTQQCFRLKEGLLDPESLFGSDQPPGDAAINYMHRPVHSLRDHF